MNQIVPWKRESSRADLDRACQSLSAGRFVGLPLETEYVVAADATNLDSVKRLAAHDSRLSVLLSDPSKVHDWLPDLSPIGKRLARKLWPGPTVLTGADGLENGRICELPDAANSLLAPDGSLAFRVSIHEAPWEMSKYSNPVAITSLGSDERRAHSAKQLVESWDEEIDIVFDDGPSPVDLSPTVVKIAGSDWTVEVEGAVAREAIADAARCRVVFVCTGNTCRSPMAETFFRNEMAAAIECSPDELAQHGFLVESAGLNAAPGCAASPESVRIAEELGGDLKHHRSRLLTLDLLLQSDYLLAMTQTHLAVLQNNLFHDGPLCALLADDGDEVPDPFGGAEEEYRNCAQRILQYTKNWAPRIQREEAAVHSSQTGRLNG